MRNIFLSRPAIAALLLLALAGSNGSPSLRIVQASTLLLEPQRPDVSSEELRRHISSMGAPFVENRGQLAQGVLFAADIRGGRVLLREQSVDYAMEDEEQGVILRESFVGGGAFAGAGLQASPTVVNFLVGDESSWRTGLPSYDTITLGDVWPGVRVDLRATGNAVEKIFTVAPYVSPSLVGMRAEGIETLDIADDGQLIFRTEINEFHQTAPIAWQERGGERVPVDVSYELRGADRYGFRLGAYDPALPLVIDPLLAGTHIGGTGVEPQNSWRIGQGGMQIDSSGNIYIGATSTSSNYPITAGVYRPTRSTQDYVLSKFSADLNTLSASTWVGGTSSEDLTPSITVDSSGNVYMHGRTHGAITTTAGAYRTTGLYSPKGFIVKLNSSLSTLLAATYTVDAPGHMYGIDTDSSGNVFVAMETYYGSTAVTAGAYNTNSSPFNQRAVLMKLNSGLTSRLAGTYVSLDDGWGGTMAVDDSTDDVLIAIQLPNSTFPTTTGAHSRTHTTSDMEIGVARFSNSLATLVAGTYLGGSGEDYALAIEGRPDGTVYVGGYTASSNFPTTAGVIDSTHSGGYNGFVTRLNSTFQVQSSTFFATSVHGLAFDASGNVYLAGQVSNAAGALPVTSGAFQTATAGNYDGFAARVDATLTTNMATTYYGSNQPDSANDILVTSSGDVYITGETSGTVVTCGYDNTGGYYSLGYYPDIYIAKFDASLSGPGSACTQPVDLTVTKTHTGDFTSGSNGTYTIIVSNIGSGASSASVATVVTDTLPSGMTFVSGTGTGWSCSAVSQTVTCTRTASIAAGGTAPTITLTVSVSGAARTANNTATVSGGNETAGYTSNNSVTDPTTIIGPLGQISVNAYIINNGPSTIDNPIVTFEIPSDLTFADATLGGSATDVCYAVSGNARRVICDTSSSLVNGVRTQWTRSFPVPQNSVGYYSSTYRLTLNFNYVSCTGGSQSRTISATIRAGTTTANATTLRDPNGLNNATSTVKTKTACLGSSASSSPSSSSAPASSSSSSSSPSSAGAASYSSCSDVSYSSDWGGGGPRPCSNR